MSVRLFTILTMAVLVGGCASVPNVPAGGPAQVQVAPASSGDRYHVQMKDAAGKSSDCDTPCTLQVTSGTAELEITGAGKFKERIVVPEGSSDASVKHSNKALYTAGLGLLAASLTILFVTVIFIKDSDTTILFAGVGGGCALGSLILQLLAGQNGVNVTASSAAPPPSPAPNPSAPTPPPATTQPETSPTTQSLLPRILIGKTSDNRGGGFALGWAF